MIDTFINTAILPKIRQISWLADNSHGLVRPATRTDETGKTITFPVACDFTSVEGGIQKMIAPDSDLTAFSFFENLTGRFREDDRNDLYMVSHSFRYLAWLNLANMGVQGCSLPLEAYFQIINTLEQKQKTVNYHIESLVTSVNTSDHRIAYGRYSFSEQERLFFYPYCFLQLDVVATIKHQKRCPVVFTPGTKIECAEIL